MKNYGMLRIILVVAVLLVGMSVAPLPGSAQTITSATLHIWGAYSTDTSATVRVHRITALWDEMSVTWNTRPTFDGAIAGSFTSGTGWLSVDVTSLVQAWASGTPNFGLLLEQDLTGYTSYSSREGSVPPWLDLCIDGQCETRYPVADAHIREIAPTTNYGSYPGLYTGLVNGYHKQSLLRFDIPVTSPGEGCTPGYWRNHFENWPSPYTPPQGFDTVFGTNFFNPDINLGTAIWARGGGLNVVARHGTAALLSAASGINYPYTVDEVIAIVRTGNVADLVAANELGCPFGQ